MATSLKTLNNHEDNVLMIPALYEEVEDLACKRQRLGGKYHIMDTIQSNDCVRFIEKILCLMLASLNNRK